ncbi:MAG: MFS transporter [Chloroflexi bacterium]|nr:MFS transporter [Chloroflexota bacterium]
MSRGTAPSAFRLLRFLATDARPLRDYRDFRLIWAGNVISSTGRQLTVVAMPYEIFLLTHSTLALGALGVAELIPTVLMSLAGGAIADAMDRRHLLLITNVLLAICSTVLTIEALLGWQQVWLIFLLAALISGIAAVDQPTRSAVIPNLVPGRVLASALSLNSMSAQLTRVIGPGVAGVIIAALGTGPCYLIDALTFAAAIGAAWAIAPQPRPGERSRMGAAIAEGVAFTWRQGILRSSFGIDAAVVIFGLKRALYPVLGTVIFAAGATGMGLLYSAQSIGSLLAGASSGWIGRTRPQGWIMIAACAGWGLSVLALGVAHSLWLASLALVAGGLFDGYSVVARGTMVQTVTPDELRGRVSAIFSMSAASSNYLGDLEAGAVASATSPAFSILSGGVAVLASVGLLAYAFPDLRRYRARYLLEGPVAEPEVLAAEEMATP